MLLFSPSVRYSVLVLYVCFGVLSFLFLSPLLTQVSDNYDRGDWSHPSMINHPNLPDTRAEAAWLNTTRAKAAFVVLTRNSELDGVRRAMWQLEARFNSKFNYPYVFLNDEPFTDEFIELTSNLTTSETKYGMQEAPKEREYGILYMETQQQRSYSKRALELS